MKSLSHLGILMAWKKNRECVETLALQITNSHNCVAYHLAGQGIAFVLVLGSLWLWWSHPWFSVGCFSSILLMQFLVLIREKNMFTDQINSYCHNYGILFTISLKAIKEVNFLECNYHFLTKLMHFQGQFSYQPYEKHFSEQLLFFDTPFIPQEGHINICRPIWRSAILTLGQNG